MTISPDDLASVRSEAETFLPQRALIRRRTIAADGRGGQTEDWFDLAADVPGRLEAVGGGPGESGEREATIQSWRWKTAHDQDLRETDLLVIDGVAYDVGSVTRTPYGAYAIAELGLAK